MHVSVYGVVTIDGMATIRARLAALMGLHLAACVDYSRALLAITTDGLDALYKAAPSRQSVPVMAWVVSDAKTAVVWRQQATRFALHGLSRFATHQPEEAREWAIEQAKTSPRRPVLR